MCANHPFTAISLRRELTKIDCCCKSKRNCISAIGILRPFSSYRIIVLGHTEDENKNAEQ